MMHLFIGISNINIKIVFDFKMKKIFFKKLKFPQNVTISIYNHTNNH